MNSSVNNPRLGLRTVFIAFAALVLLAVTVPGTANASSEGSCRASHTNNNCDGAPVSVSDGVCWDSNAYPVPEKTLGYADVAYFWAGDWKYGTEVWYSPDCQTNWAVAYVAGGNQTQCGISVSTKVRRYAGADGGYLMYQAYWGSTCSMNSSIIVSPMVWAPDNPAQACGRLSSNDQVVCTNEW